MPDTTDLVLNGIGVTPYSARGLTQTLEPISQAVNLRRTVNGSLIDVSASQFRKYRSTITGNDQQPPALDGIWPGLFVVVDCVAFLAFPSAGSPARTIVPGSDYSEGGFTFYRPRLQMRVMNFNINRDEYGHLQNWSLELEEA